MNNNYILKPTKSKDFNFICFSLNESRPDEYFDNLEKDLRNLKKASTILLDLYQSNGNGSRRFFKVFFDGENLNLQNIEKIAKENIDDKIFNDCQYFYAAH